MPTSIPLAALCLLYLAAAPSSQAADRPNILWITCEDMGPHIGPWGDDYATTPNLDRFAQSALRYTRCWSNAPVCAPARTTLITGSYATALGAEHMRSLVHLPEGYQLYPQVLRQAGYYCTNNAKEDYNIIPRGEVWDESSRQAHWKNRPDGKPFFAVFNIEATHEGQIQKRRQLTHDPSRVRLPAYCPDLPEIREDWAQYYDNITRMDELVGERLQELEDAGLADDTIVWFYSDHGAGLPRNKRCAQDSGLRVPLMIRIPDKFQSLRPVDYAPGGESARLISFVDFGPTLLSLAGQPAPNAMQGRPFLNSDQPPRSLLFGFRSRMDERPDLVRCVRDQRYVYVRNFLPRKPQGQQLAYMFLQAGTRAWKAAFDAGRLNEQQAAFFQPKPVEALYDLETDPEEVENLAARPEHASRLTKFREALRQHMLESGDRGLIPESELHRLAGGAPLTTVPSHWGPGDWETLFDAADRASRTDQPLPDSDPTAAAPQVFWHTLGILHRGEDAVRARESTLISRLSHDSPSVRIVAAEALVRHGSPETKGVALNTLAGLASANTHGLYVAVEALNAIDSLDDSAAPILDRLSEDQPDDIPRRLRNYVPRLINDIR